MGDRAGTCRSLSGHNDDGSADDNTARLILGRMRGRAKRILRAETGGVGQSRVLSGVVSSNEECTDAYGLVRALLTDRGSDDCSVASEATEQAFLQCHKIKGAQLWGTLADEAEHHGVAPLIEPMITALSRKRPDAVPDDVRRAFVALASRHRRAAVARDKCVDQ